MVKILLILGLSLLSSACASATHFYDGPEREANQIAVITSKMTSATAELLKELFGKTPGLRPVTLHVLDGRQGPNNYPPYSQFYNSTWDWSLQLHILPGKHTLTVMPNHFRDADTPTVQFEFTAEAGHNYYLGQILEATRASYRWQPILVDQKANILVFPEIITWKPN